jgi:CRP-like cAMP-binding protein
MPESHNRCRRYFRWRPQRVTVSTVSVDLALVENVARLALFADLDYTEIENVLPMVEEVLYHEGQWVVRRGDVDVGLNIIVDGEVSVVLEGDELASLSKGSFFGEISALLGEPTVADIIARTPLQCLSIKPEEVEDFLVANPKVMFRMLQAEARRLRTTDERRI